MHVRRIKFLLHSFHVAIHLAAFAPINVNASKLAVLTLTMKEDDSPYVATKHKRLYDLAAELEARGLIQPKERLDIIRFDNTEYQQTHLFAIRDNDLYLIAPMDRDNASVCPPHTQCVLPLIIELNRRYFRINMMVEDINDNSPFFPTPKVVKYLGEEAPTGTEIQLDAATDKDAEENGVDVESYAVLDESRTFRFEPTTMMLVLTKPLDFETIKRYDLKYIVNDKGQPRRTGTQHVTIDIRDINDWAPEFVNLQTNVTIAESTPVGTVVTRVLAKDKDSGDNGAVSYSLDAFGKCSLANGYFRIHPASGELTLTKVLDAKANDRYELCIIASDRAKERSKKRKQTLSIHVRDENDHRPEVDLGTDQSFEVQEGKPPGTSVGKLIIRDMDVGENAEFACDITDQFNRFALQAIYGSVYMLNSRVTFDRESMKNDSKVQVRISCKDRGTPSQQSTTDIYVKVLDVNEFAPYFTSSTYEARVMENTAPVVITTVHAVDADIDSVLRYTLLEEQFIKGAFQIGELSGTVKLTKPLDRENNFHRKITLRVLVTDDETVNKPHSATCTIRVIVDDQNDCVPYLYTNGVLSVKENAGVPSFIGTAEGRDDDEGENGHIQYSLVEIKTSYERRIIRSDWPFNVSTSGKVFCVGHLDREVVASYKLVILLQDGGRPSNSEKVTITVELVDVNDNSPIWEFPSSDRDNINITSNYVKNQYVKKLKAKDIDDHRHTNLTYSFVYETDDTKYFVLHAIMGTLRMAKAKITTGSYRLPLRASDNAIPPRHSDTVLIVNVLDAPASATRQLSFGINFGLIIVMIAITTFVSVGLLVSIVLVRRGAFTRCISRREAARRGSGQKSSAATNGTTPRKLGGSSEEHTTLYSEIPVEYTDFATVKYRTSSPNSFLDNNVLETTSHTRLWSKSSQDKLTPRSAEHDKGSADSGQGVSEDEPPTTQYSTVYRQTATLVRTAPATASGVSGTCPRHSGGGASSGRGDTLLLYGRGAGLPSAAYGRTLPLSSATSYGRGTTLPPYATPSAAGGSGGVYTAGTAAAGGSVYSLDRRRRDLAGRGGGSGGVTTGDQYRADPRLGIATSTTTYYPSTEM